ncbi:MAG: threonine-phosphate decarboxylase [Alphaproteobacteria bacterium]|nr:threonine-phosphate decarboxylase [Alphaproteobacteria bacterium]
MTESGGGSGTIDHGGNLAAARRRFAGAPEPFIDLSTGINPVPWPVPGLPGEALARLPGQEALDRLAAAAARLYGAPDAACVVAAPGTQILLPLVAALRAPGRAAVLGPTYAEHARAAALAGHAVAEVERVDGLAGAGLAVVVNPNNPDGRLVPHADLLALAGRAGLLVVDEAFMDVGPAGASLAGDVAGGGIVVLRSFGKFFGLAGLRLGFALATPDIAAALRARLGPWAVSGPALAIGAAALADTDWIAATRVRLAADAARLDGLLAAAGLAVAGGTALFRLVETPAAAALYERLGRQGILVRRFAERSDRLRFGLPGHEAAWRRLAAALVAGS